MCTRVLILAFVPRGHIYTFRNISLFRCVKDNYQKIGLPRSMFIMLRICCVPVSPTAKKAQHNLVLFCFSANAFSIIKSSPTTGQPIVRY